MKTNLATVLIANTKQKFLQRRISTFVALSVLKSQADKVQFEHTVHDTTQRTLQILSAKSRHLFERVSYLQKLGMVPVSSISSSSRLSLLNCGAMSTPKLLNTTLDTSLPLSVAVYLSCEAHCQISVRLRKNFVRDVTLVILKM